MQTTIIPFEDWVNKVSSTTKHDLIELLDFKDHYQNLLSYEENLKNFENYLVD